MAPLRPKAPRQASRQSPAHPPGRVQPPSAPGGLPSPRKLSPLNNKFFPMILGSALNRCLHNCSLKTTTNGPPVLSSSSVNGRPSTNGRPVTLNKLGVAQILVSRSGYPWPLRSKKLQNDAERLSKLR